MRRKQLLAMLGRRSLSSWAPLLGCAGVLTITAPSHAQVLNITPSCGVAGSSVTITGSSWAEPEPLCRYVFTFNGAMFAPDQQDGLYGPPNASGTVPAVAPGTYRIRTDLRRNDPDQRVQCRQRNFCVVAMVADPWNGGANIGTGGNGILTSLFNPSNVCDVTDCTQIVPIQIIQHTGQTASGTRKLTFAETGHPYASTHQLDVTAAGWTIDYLSATPGGPYYPYPAPGQIRDGTQGCGRAFASSHGDQPKYYPNNFPADVNTIVLNFEVDYFCAAGENRGEFLGQFFWTWTKTKASATNTNPFATNVTHTAPTRAQPTPAFTDALNLYITNHAAYSVPMGMPSNPTGDPCS